MRPMAKRIEILAGIAATGKTTELLATYRHAIRGGFDNMRPGTTLWLSPTNRAQAELRDRLLDPSLPAVFRPNLATFDAFADQVLKSAPQSVTRLSSAMQRILLRRVIMDAYKRWSRFEDCQDLRLSRFGVVVHFQIEAE